MYERPYFLNQLSYDHKVTYPNKGDFLINNTYLIEIEGNNKTTKQNKNIE